MSGGLMDMRETCNCSELRDVQLVVRAMGSNFETIP